VGDEVLKLREMQNMMRLRVRKYSNDAHCLAHSDHVSNKVSRLPENHGTYSWTVSKLFSLYLRRIEKSKETRLELLFYAMNHAESCCRHYSTFGSGSHHIADILHGGCVAGESVTPGRGLLGQQTTPRLSTTVTTSA